MGGGTSAVTGDFLSCEQGQIQLLQRLLGQTESPRDGLVNVPLDQLTAQRDRLQVEYSNCKV